MNNWIQLHRKYLWNKTNLILLIAIMGIVVIGLFLATAPTMKMEEKWFYQCELQQNYQNTATSFIEMITVVLACFLFGTSYLKVNDHYRMIIIEKKHQRCFYYISKQLALFVLFFSIVLYIYFLYCVIGLLFIPNFVIQFVDFKIYFQIYGIGIIYGLLSAIVVLLFSHSLGYIFIMILFIVVKVIQDMQPNINPFLYHILPYVFQNGERFSFSSLFLPLWIESFFWFHIGLILYYEKNM